VKFGKVTEFNSYCNCNLLENIHNIIKYPCSSPANALRNS